MPKTFAELGLPALITDVLVHRDIIDPFPIQSATIPDALAGRDVAGRAPTGSGKTLAFGLPMLTLVGKAKPNKPRALILAPTRELAAQIRLDLAPYAKAMDRQVFAIYGGVRYTPQKEWLRRGVDVLVATPGRLEDLIEQRFVDLSEVDIVTIDEADRMADMGFLPAVKRILDQTSNDGQTLLFSATLDGDVAVLIKRYQRDPARHEIGGAELQVTEATHHFWVVEHQDKVRHTADVIGATGSTIVFAKTRHGTNRLAKQLAREGVDAVAMHGGLSQNQRNRALKSFSDGRALALIATDVAARGIHVDDVSTVIHFDIPHGHKDYLHRSGRTARAGASGTVVSLLTHAEKRAVIRMQRNLDMNVAVGPARPESLIKSDLRSQKSDRTTATDNREQGQFGRKAKGGEPKSNGRQRNDSKPKAVKQERQVSKHIPANGKNRDSSHQSVYIGNLPWKITNGELAAIAATHGRVHAASVKMDGRGRSKGVGFVTMSRDDATRAVRALNGSTVGGRPLKVRFAETRNPNS
ncbi:MAG: DEAD/DEAH box helicase [Acidimicrobiia bacterium]|nr:DEAD/DEAH box helicase [Acidimicrobiia bacterium]